MLHVALRAPARASDASSSTASTWCPTCTTVLDRMAAFAERCAAATGRGHTGKRIRNVVNIGIGGSDLGPVMAYEALRHYSQRDLTFRFVSNVDGTDFVEATRDLDPAETLFIVCSKTFTTLETLTNAHAARDWCAERARRRGGGRAALRRGLDQRRGSREVRHRYGQHVRLLGLGRRPLLDGFGDRPVDHDRDRRRSTSARCWPASTRWTSTFAARRSSATCRCCMGLLAIWNNDFLGAQTVAVLPYEQYLKRFPAYLQQLTMESNGKHVTRRRRAVDYQTGAGLLGRAGHQRPAFVLPVDPPGHAARAVRLHRLLPAAEPAGRPARSADGQPVRAERGAGVRQDARTRSRAEGVRRTSWCRIASSRATGRATRSSPSG